ncbi:MAG: YCF48-related protein [Desulfuromonadaceae bacterium]|nr:YCF48-related protein [Desulfuromonadaceae bacterium]
MKYRILAVSLLAAAIMFSVAYSQISFKDVLDTPSAKSALATKTLYNGIVLAGKRLISVGQRGHIVYSDDQGNNWIQASVPVTSDLTAVTFPTPQKGWAVGHDGVVLHSADAGVTWKKQFDGRAAAQVMTAHHKALKNCASCHDNMEIPKVTAQGAEPAMMAEIKSLIEKGADKPFLDVWFENETTGFIIGAFNLIFRTVDGGKTWEPWFDRTENKKRLHLYAVRQVGQELYIVGEQGLVLKLDKQSGQFRAQKVPYNGTFFGLTGKPGSVTVFGMRGNVFRSTDVGNSWKKIETGMSLGLIGSTVTTDGRIVLLSQAGRLLVSGDDGASFTTFKLGQPFPASALVAIDKENFVLAGLHGMLKQTVK